MEGLENSGVPSKPALRLMRFSFEPNPPLLKSTTMFIQESRRSSTPIRFYASRQLLLQMPNYYEHEGSLQRIGRKFTAFNEPLHVAPMIGSKELNGGITRFQLRTTDQQAFDSLTSLEVRPETKYAQYVSYEHAPLQQLPNELDTQPIKGHYLFVDIASTALLKASELRMAENTFIGKAAADKFFLHTIALSSVRDIYQAQALPVQRPQGTPEGNSYSSIGDDDQLPKAG